MLRLGFRAAALLPPRRRRPRGVATAAAAAANGGGGRLDALLRSTRITAAAHELWAEVVRPGDTVVDATAGNGHDALAMARLAGPTGTLHAFDVQQGAVDATRRRLAEGLAPGAAPRVHLVRGCHSGLLEAVGGPGAAAAGLVAFNLGYWPGGADKAVATAPATTLPAVRGALAALREGGLLSVLAYTGHPGGREEADAVEAELAALDTGAWLTARLALLNRPAAPLLLLAWRRREGCG